MGVLAHKKKLVGAISAVYALYRYLGLNTNPVVQLLKLTVRAIMSKLTVPLARFLQGLVSNSPKLPTRPSNITAPFIEWVLKKQGFQNTIRSLKIKPFDAGKTSKAVRIYIEYNEQQSYERISRPSSLVCKMSREDIEGRVFNLVAGLYREAEFYSVYGNSCLLTVPTVYYSNVSMFSYDFLIIMEDLAPATVIAPPDILRTKYTWDTIDDSWSVPIETVEKCIQQLVPFHSKFLGKRKELATQEWLISPFKDGRKSLKLYNFYFKTSWKKSKAMAAKGRWISTPWPHDFVDTVDRFTRDYYDLMLADETLWPRGMNHGDFHGMNILEKDDRLVVLDFQITGVGPALMDVGYFLATALSSEDRRTHEERLVRMHYDGLIEGNNFDDPRIYPFELYYERYKLMGYYKVVLLVICAATIMADGKEEDAYMVSWIHHRLAKFTADHGDPLLNWRKSTERRRKLLKQYPDLAKRHGYSV
jgi:thiamine kinase-like enzyme